MGIEEKNMNKTLSRIVADLCVKSKGDDELSSKIDRLRDEINKVIEGEDTIFRKFRDLVESFREIIPEEKQRYNAAIKALSTTSKLSRQEIIKAINNQLAELKILEKGLMPALPGWRDEFKAMETRSRELRDEIAKLREKIGRLESEEKGILNGMAAREKEMELVENAVGELLEEIGEEITDIKEKVEEFTDDGAASHPTPKRASIKRDIPIEEKGGGEQKNEIHEPSAQQDTEWQEKIWLCYVCAYEEVNKDEFPGKSEEKRERVNSLKTNPALESIFDESPPPVVPLASMSSDEDQESKHESAASKSPPSSKKKTCPVCGKKMSWYPTEKAWRCSYCHYERSI
jgi:uncharacterized protein YoxC